MKWKISLSLGFILLCLLMPLGYALEWNVLQEPYGTWENCNRTEWETINGDNYGNASWYVDVENFTGYNAEYYVSEFSNYRLAWWHESSSKNFIIKTKFQINETHSIITWVWFSSYQRLWGAIYKNVVKMDITLSEAESCTFLGEYTITNLESYAVLDVWYNSTTQELRVYLYHVADGSRSKEEALIWNVSSTDLDNITITQSIYHYGVGKFTGFMSDTIYQNEPYTPSIPQISEEIVHDIWHFINILSDSLNKYLPTWLRDWINSFGAWFDWLIGILGIIWGAILNSIDFIPLIVLFWLLDAIATSIYYGNLHPIGNCFMTVYQFATNIISALNNIAHAIYDIITFWS